MDLITTIIGTVIGGLIGYYFSHLQWKKSLEGDNNLYLLENKRNLVELSYETIEFARDYSFNSKYMDISDFMACMSGKNPIKRVLAVVVTNVPEMLEDVTKLAEAIDSMMGPEYPVPDDKRRQAIRIANEFGIKALAYVKSHP